MIRKNIDRYALDTINPETGEVEKNSWICSFSELADIINDFNGFICGDLMKVVDYHQLTQEEFNKIVYLG